ncbi:outer membrane protein [Thioclava sp.]|uniref:outer membrane protein n=1 Tax=Thioclava sp. TaxID=1933450 RepID=UPI003AA8D262
MNLKTIIASAAIALNVLATSASAENVYGYVLANRTLVEPNYTYSFGDTVPIKADGNGITLGFGKALTPAVAIEGDISFGDYESNRIVGSTFPCVTIGEGCKMKADWLATLRVTARTEMGKLSPYVTAGFAAGHIKGSADTGPCGFIDCGYSGTQAGFALGLGTDYALSDRIALRAELMQILLKSPDFSASTVTSGGYAFTQIRVGMKYAF